MTARRSDGRLRPPDDSVANSPVVGSPVANSPVVVLR